MTNPQAVSFRDPEGRVFFYGRKVFRALNPAGEASIRALLASEAARRLWESGALVPTRVLSDEERAALLDSPRVREMLADLDCRGIAEHDAAPFASYPHEWPPEMLHAAAGLTIRLAREFAGEGMGLKDATPSNVMFWGPRPVFLDALSFEKRDPHDPTWLPYGQFVRTFLLPLLVNRRRGIPLSEIFTTRRDGLEPEEVYPLLGRLERLQPRPFALVSFPVWFGKRGGSEKIYEPRRLKNAEQAGYILQSLLRRQERALKQLRPEDGRESAWSDYTQGNNNYTDAQAEAKVRMTRQFLEEARPAEVLDVGCNTGVFSFLAAEAGARVVAVDYDPVVVGRLWKAAAGKNAPILPLVVNIARPTPAIGWANRECRSFLERAAGAFDAVLMLALAHHLIVSERVPLADIFALARGMTRRWLLIEYVGPADSMFQRLTRGRAHLHRDLNPEAFERAAERHFRVARSEPIPGGDRRLYLMEARA